MEHYLKFISNHRMLDTVINKLKYLHLYDLPIYNVSDPSEHFLQCQGLRRSILKLAVI